MASVPSEAVPLSGSLWFFLASVCRSLQCLISALTQAGGGGLFFRFASSVALRGGGGAVFPVYAAQAPGCSIWSGPCIACGSSFWVLHKSTDSVALAFCAFPGRSSSGSQELDRHTLPGRGTPSALRGPSLSFCPCQSGACALCLAATLLANVDPPESQEVFG